MNRTLSILVVAVIACGGSSAPPTTPLPPEPEAKPAEEAKATPPPAKPEPPPTVTVDRPIDVPKSTLKLVKGGSGKKAVLKLAAAQGTKQHVDLLLDFLQKTDAPADVGGSQQEIVPTVVLASDVEVGEVGSDGTAKFTVTVSGTDAKDRAGAMMSGADFKAQKMGDVTGLTVTGSVSPNGQAGPMTMHLEKADARAKALTDLIRLLLAPLWPQLPTEPIGVGAKWTVSTPVKIVDQLDATQTVEYEVVSHKGSAWELKGTVKIAGATQKIDTTSFDKIGGSGSIAMTMTDGTFVPQSTSSLTSEFQVSVTLPANAGSAAGQQRSAQVHLEQGFGVSPK